MWYYIILSFLLLVMANIASINVNGLNDMLKCEAIFQNIKSGRHDIMFLQHTHLNPQTVGKAISSSRWKGKKFHSFSPDNWKGASILLSDKLNAVIHSQNACSHGHYVIVHLSFGGKSVLLINIYAPTGNYAKTQQRKQLFSTITSEIDKYPDVDCVIIGGDFNCVTNKFEDLSKTISYSDKSTKRLGDLVWKHDLEDIRQTLHPNELPLLAT